MKEIVLKYDTMITSYIFYDHLLKKINQLIDKKYDGCIVLDLTDVGKIESPVIPNLLIIGDYIKQRVGILPHIIIDESQTSGALKKYLYAIMFFPLCETNNRFLLECNKYSGWPEKSMEELNTTVFFEKATKEELSKEQAEKDYPMIVDRVWRGIYDNLRKFADKYLMIYQESVLVNDEREKMKKNMAIVLIHELVKNALIHGRKYAYVTFQIDYSRKKIYITISDAGKGFLQSMNEKKIRVDNEAEAIIEGLFTRVEEDGYGLFDVVKRTLESNGLVRIHSCTTQIILTSKDKNLYLSCLQAKDKNKLLQILYSKKNYNYRTGLVFPGVHVEIELPC